jgi:hypothetical protein
LFRRSPKVAPAVYSDITEDPTTEIEKLYMSLPNTYSYNSTKPQLENMLDAKVRYFVATNSSPSDDYMTFDCKCAITVYNKEYNIMTALIKAPSRFKDGWEIDSTPTIHQGDLQLTPISPVKLDLIDNSVINIVDITISKHTIDTAICVASRSTASV